MCCSTAVAGVALDFTDQNHFVREGYLQRKAHEGLREFEAVGSGAKKCSNTRKFAINHGMDGLLQNPTRLKRTKFM
jgi:hypothetical protein